MKSRNNSKMNSQWVGTSLRWSGDSSCFKERLKQENIELREEDTEVTLENQENYFIYENEFIAQSTNLSSMLNKYKQKDYSDKSKEYVVEKNDFINIPPSFSDINKYLEVIKNNIIDGDVRDLNISINILNNILDNSKKSRLFLDFLILCALGNRVSYDAECAEIEIQLEDDSYKISIDITSSDSINLYPIYNWIFNNDEYKESYLVKLQIVRQVIIRKRNIRDVSNMLIDSTLAYKRIISKKTEDYFNQLNQLKDDFLVLTKNENSALRALNVTFFAWLGYLGVELFKIIVNYNKPDILKYLFCSTGAKKGLVILGFIIALLFIFFAYVLEIKSLEKTYNVIKGIYNNKILFEDNSSKDGKFENTISKPEVGILQMSVFILLLLLLFIRFFITFPW